MNVKGRATRIWGAQPYGALNWTQDCFGPGEAFSTYLNYKLEEELTRYTQRIEPMFDRSGPVVSGTNSPPRAPEA